MRLDASLSGVEAWLAAAAQAADEGARQGMHAVDGLVADEARRAHPYQNRTTDLQNATQPGAVGGSLLSRSLRGQVVGDTPYGEYVEERHSRQFAFLLPAFLRKQNEAGEAMSAALDAALRGIP